MKYISVLDGSEYKGNFPDIVTGIFSVHAGGLFQTNYESAKVGQPRYPIVLDKWMLEHGYIRSDKIHVAEKGGPGSGNFGHAGRPGEVGGSAPKGGIRSDGDGNDNPMDNPNFRAWFEGSKVVDENGDPLVVYHGTTQTFESFSREMIGSKTDTGYFGSGYYFTPESELASSYAIQYEPDNWDTGFSYNGGRVLPVYLSVKNPYDFRNDPIPDGVPKEHSVTGKTQPDVRLYGSEAFRNKLEDMGFDGVFVYDDIIQSDKPASDDLWLAVTEYYWKNKPGMKVQREWLDKTLSNGALYEDVLGYYGKEIADRLPKKKILREVVAFYPEQIKSIFNPGEFDPDDPRILKQVVEKGGKGSGNFGHAGRPGEVGGSAPKDSLSSGGSGEEPREGYGVLKNNAVPAKLTEKDIQKARSIEYRWKYNERMNDVFSVSGKNPYKLTANEREKLTEKVVDRLAGETGIDGYIVNDYLASWASSSNHNDASAMLQKAAADVFNIELSAWQKDIFEHNGKPFYHNKNEAEKLIKQIYANTQELFASHGYKPDDKITVFRGMESRNLVAGIPGISNIKYTGNVMESWSYEPLSATSFGFVFAIDIPVKNIISTSLTGFGYLREAEMVVLGNSDIEVQFLHGMN